MPKSSPRLATSVSAARGLRLVQVLTGCVREHHRFLLEQHLRTIEQLEDSVAAFDARIEAALSPFHDIVERLKEVPGLGATAMRP
jgi:transposase